MTHVFITAGESSGDRLGAMLARRLRALDPGVRISGLGGLAMAAEGVESLFPMQDIAVMGFLEVIPAIPRVLRRVEQTAQAVAAARPDALVTIDAQGFSARVQDRVAALSPGVTRIQYVTPSVWAWKPGRAARLAARVDHALALLPFEPPWFTRHGLSCECVGHPAVERAALSDAQAARALRASLGIGADAPVLVALPGSRTAEVTRLAAPFGATIAALRARHPDLVTILPAAEAVADAARAAAAGWPGRVHVLDPGALDFETAERRKYAAFRAADVALAASGTVSVELAASGTPMVTAYRTHPLTAAIARHLITAPSVTLVNLVLKAGAVPEYLQEYFVPERVARDLDALLPGGKERAWQVSALERAAAAMGGEGAPPSLRAAQSVLAAVQRAPTST